MYAILYAILSPLFTTVDGEVCQLRREISRCSSLWAECASSTMSSSVEAPQVVWTVAVHAVAGGSLLRGVTMKESDSPKLLEAQFL